MMMIAVMEEGASLIFHFAKWLNMVMDLGDDNARRMHDGLACEHVIMVAGTLDEAYFHRI